MRIKVLTVSLMGILFLGIKGWAEEPEPMHRFSANLTVISEYIYRGLAQTDHQPAIQGGFDYTHRSGLYVGNWNATSSWLADTGLGVNNTIEMDLYAGFRGSLKDISYDLGGLLYLYPGRYSTDFTNIYNRPDTFELYAALGYRWFTLKYSHALTDLFGNVDSSGSGYLEFNAGIEILKKLALNGHAGHQWVKNLGLADYSDWRLGLTYDLGPAVLGLTYSGTDADEAFYSNPVNTNLGKGRFLFSITRSI